MAEAAQEGLVVRPLCRENGWDWQKKDTLDRALALAQRLTVATLAGLLAGNHD